MGFNGFKVRLVYTIFTPNIYQPKRLTMASIQKRDNKYRVQISKMGIRKNATFRTKSEAQQWAYEEERKIEIIVKGGAVAILFADVIRRYQQEVSPNKKTGMQEIRRLNRVLAENIANRYISDISKDDVQMWVNDRLATGVKPSSVKRELTILSHIFKLSVERWGYILKSPMIGVEQPESSKPRTQRYLQEEIDLLVEQSGFVCGLNSMRAKVVGALLFSIETAMRAGEIRDLTWDKVFLDKRIVYLPMTKNGSERYVPLSGEAIKILKRFEELKHSESGSVFQIKHITQNFNALKTALGLHHLHFHDARREACSRLAKKVDVMTLAKISGHKDIKILLNTYYAPDMSEVAGLLD